MFIKPYRSLNYSLDLDEPILGVEGTTYGRPSIYEVVSIEFIVYRTGAAKAVAKGRRCRKDGVPFTMPQDIETSDERVVAAVDEARRYLEETDPVFRIATEPKVES